MDVGFDVLMKDYKNAVDHLHNLGWIHVRVRSILYGSFTNPVFFICRTI